MHNNNQFRRSLNVNPSSGFSLVELMVTLGVFLVISGAVLNLVSKHIPLFASQQSQAGMNFGLRNAAAQLQIDGANAGSGFYPSQSTTSFPIGMTIVPGDATKNCYDATNHTYGQDCFDTITILKVDKDTPPAQVIQSGVTAESTTAGSLFVKSATTSADKLAGFYKAGDYVLLLNVSDGTMTVVMLSDDAKVSDDKVHFLHHKTKDDKASDGETPLYPGINDPKYDPFGITTTKNNKLGENFYEGDWAVKITPVVYKVDAKVPSNPKLVRLQVGTSGCNPLVDSPPYDDKCVIAEQVIGFRVGAQISEDPEPSASKTDCKPYCYDPSSYGMKWNEIRSVRATLIGRTAPNTSGGTAHNDFDKGPYKIEAVSVVLNPRSLSLGDSEVTAK